MIRWRVPQIDCGKTQLSPATRTAGAKAKRGSKIARRRHSARGPAPLKTRQAKTTSGMMKIKSTTAVASGLMRLSALLSEKMNGWFSSSK